MVRSCRCCTCSYQIGIAYEDFAFATAHTQMFPSPGSLDLTNMSGKRTSKLHAHPASNPNDRKNVGDGSFDVIAQVMKRHLPLTKSSKKNTLNTTLTSALK